MDSIIICGSAVQTNYKEYNDIDVIIATKKVITEGMKEKYKLISKIEDDGKKAGLILDVQIYAKKSILDQYPHNPSLIYQLKDSKVIYGRFQLPRKISLSNLDLKMKLDWSEIVTKSSEAKEVYDAIRNAMLVLLLMNKKVDNGQLRMNVMNVLGADLISKLKSNKASPLEKKLSLSYLTLLTGYLEEELNKPQWEKIELENL